MIQKIIIHHKTKQRNKNKQYGSVFVRTNSNDIKATVQKLTLKMCISLCDKETGPQKKNPDMTAMKPLRNACMHARTHACEHTHTHTHTQTHKHTHTHTHTHTHSLTHSHERARASTHKRKHTDDKCFVDNT